MPEFALDPAPSFEVVWKTLSGNNDRRIPKAKGLEDPRLYMQELFEN